MVVFFLNFRRLYIDSMLLVDRMNKWMNAWMNEWMNEWMDGWMDEWVNERMTLKQNNNP